MPSDLRRTRWATGAVTLAATISLGATSLASADPTRTSVTATRESPSQVVQSQPNPVRVTPVRGPGTEISPGDAYMGWRSVSPERSVAASSARSAVAAPTTGVQGIDVSGWQRTVDWAAWKAKGKSFAYVKATEGKTFRNPYFSAQYTGSYRVGMIRGAYHYALPNRSRASTQAKFFAAHGGGWSKDGRTLPGVLDIEYNPYGSTCYGFSKKEMVSWIKSFTKQYKKSTGRDAVIYTNLDWWTRCTGNSKAFNKSNPLWVARYAKAVGTLPGGWKSYTFWQYKITPLDQDRFRGSRSRLVALAKG